MPTFQGQYVVDGVDEDLSGYTIYGSLSVTDATATFGPDTQLFNADGTGPGGVTLANGTIVAADLDISAGVVINANSRGAILAKTIANSADQTFQEGQTFGISGALTNTGSLSFIGSANFGQVVWSVQPDGLTLSGGGTVNLSVDTGSGNSASVQSAGVATSFENQDNTIQGAGAIGDANLSVQNDMNGVIDASQAGATLYLAPGGLLDNSGLLEATNGGALQIGGAGGAAAWTNEAPGRIEASNGSDLALVGPYTNYGEIRITLGSTAESTLGGADNEGTITVDDSSFSIDADNAAWTNNGSISVVDDSTLSIKGALNNQSTVTVANSTLNLTFGGDLNNSGSIALTQSTLNLVGAFTLGSLGAHSFDSASGDTYANATVTSATVNLHGVLKLDTVNASISPASVGVGDTLDATQGFYADLAMTNLSEIDGGTVIVSAAAGGPAGSLNLANNGISILHDSLIVSAGAWSVGANFAVNLVADGELRNSGVVTLGGGYEFAMTTFRVGADGLKLTGGGGIDMADDPYGYNNSGFYSNGVATTLENVDNTIRGSGYLGDALLTIKNDHGGAIIASKNVYNYHSMYLAGYGLLDNDGLIEAISDGSESHSLQIGGQAGAASWTNEADGTIEADGADAQIILAGPFVNYGLVVATNNGQGYAIGSDARNHGVISADDSTFVIDGSAGGWINQSDGQIEATDDATLDITGPFGNEGAISVTNSTLDLRFGGALNNNGSIALDHSNLNLWGSLTLESVGAASYDAASGNAYANTTTTSSTVNLYGVLKLDTVNPSISLASVGVGDTLDATQGFYADLAMTNLSEIDGGTVIVSAAAGGPAGSLNLANDGISILHDALIVTAGAWSVGANFAVNLVADGELRNSGVVTLGGGYEFAMTSLRVGADGLKLTGGGGIDMADDPYGYNNSGFYSNGVATTLENVDNTIRGSGYLGDALLTIKNDHGGAIIASKNVYNYYGMYLAAYGLLDNDGLIEAISDGSEFHSLQIGGQAGAASWTNEADGTIKADGADAQIILAGPFVNYGLTEASNSGTVYSTQGEASNHGQISVDGGNFYLGGASGTWNNGSDGRIDASNGGSLSFGGAVDNEGAVSVVDSTLTLTTGAALTNNGSITFTNSTLNLQGSLTLGSLGAYTYSPTTGAVYANISASGLTVNLDGTLTLDTAPDPSSLASVGVGDTLDATQGFYANLVLLDGAEVAGGTVVIGASGATLAVAPWANVKLHDALVINSGTFTLPGDDANRSLVIDGVLDNSGVIHVTSANGVFGALRVGADGLKLTGGGTISLEGGRAGLLSGGGASLENVDDTITGGGSVGDAALAIHNDAGATISAAASQSLYLADDDLLVNDGLIESTGGAYLRIGGSNVGRWTNAADGTISADGGEIALNSSEIDNAGRIEAKGGGTLDLVMTGALDNSGGISADDATVNLSGVMTFADLGGVTYSADAGDTIANFSITNAVATALYGQLTLDTLDPSISLASVGVGDTLDATQGAFANLLLYGGAVIDGGTVIASAASGGGVLSVASGAFAVIDDALVINAGRLAIDPGVSNSSYTTWLVLDRVLQNKGVVALNGGYNPASGYTSNAVLGVGSDGLLVYGGGTITLNSLNGLSVIDGWYRSATLENVDNLIEGAGYIGDDSLLTVQNDAGGVIDANVRDDYLGLSNNSLLDNHGLLEATNQGQLGVGGGLATWTNEADGVIRADGGIVTLSGSFVNSGKIEVVDDGVLNLVSTPYDIGEVTESSGRINISASLSLSDLNQLTSTITRAGGSLWLQEATLDLGGGSIDITQGVYRDLNLAVSNLSNGTILGGPDDQLTVDGSYNTLSAVNVQGGLQVVNNSTAILQNDSQVLDAAGAAPGAITVSGASAVAFLGYSHIANDVTLSSSVLDLVDPAPVASALNTGDDGLAGGLADSNWQVNGNPAVALTNLRPEWTPNNGFSAWIGVDDSISEPAGPGSFSTSFSVDDASAPIFGVVYSDDPATVSLNGNVIASTDDDWNGMLVELSRDDGLQAGVNTLSIDMANPDQFYDGVRFQALSPITIDAGATIEGSGSISDQLGGFNPAYVINQGVIDANDGGNLQIVSIAFKNEGTVKASHGTLYISPGLLVNLWNNVLTGGEYSAGANSQVVIGGGQTIVTDAANIVYGGVNADVDGAAQTLTTVTATGRLEVDAGAQFAAVNAIDDSGQIVLAGGEFIDSAGLAIAASGGLSGYGSVGDDVSLSGSVFASGGTLQISGAVQGGGSIGIDSGATLKLASYAAPVITFSGASTLKLDNSAAFAANTTGLTGLRLDDSIDLTDAQATAYSLNGAKLTVDLAGSASLEFDDVTGVGGAALANLYFWIEDDQATGTQLTVYDTAQTVSVAYFLANQAKLDARGHYFVADSWANIAGSLSALDDDAHVRSIEVTDAAAPVMTLSLADALANPRALGVLSSGSPNWTLADDRVSVTDTAATVAGLKHRTRLALAAEGIFAAEGYVGNTLTQTETWDADDNLGVHYYKGGVILGAAYASYALYSSVASGLDHAIYYTSGGAELARQTFSPGGGRRIDLFNPTTSDIVKVKTINPDKSADIDTRNAGKILGVAYTHYDIVITSTGVIDHTDYFDASGAKIASAKSGAGGSRITTIFDPVTEQPTQIRTVAANGSFVTRLFQAGSIYGASYASYDLSYTAAGVLLSQSFNDANNMQVALQSYLPGGTRTIAIYDPATGATQMFKDIRADGFSSVTYAGTQGQSYTSRTAIFDPSAALVAQALDYDDGTGRAQLAGDDLTVFARAGAFGVDAGSDAFALAQHATQILALGGAGETVALGSGFGSLTLAGFDPGASNHDALDLNLSMFDSSWFSAATTPMEEAAALLDHAAGVANIVVTDLADDRLTLFGVSRATLAANLDAIHLS